MSTPKRLNIDISSIYVSVGPGPANPPDSWPIIMLKSGDRLRKPPGARRPPGPPICNASKVERKAFKRGMPDPAKLAFHWAHNLRINMRIAWLASARRLILDREYVEAFSVLTHQLPTCPPPRLP